jgi:hypothetical protein
MIRWAPWERVASDLATGSLRGSGGESGTRFAVRHRPAAFWIGLWAAAAVAELLALRPVVFDRDAPIVGLHGELRVTSPPGAGTTVTAQLPCGS